ncbi:hypothetical protein KR51_00027700 [Rubidibacter lacunae KORDI 51-2]|uniref:Uncharacterized protein n=1 Tax=Rubidibacter lacunae KORDI 51-2 TaxID=582515 RepID=U5DGQ2_9CHRO|nr:hypothetical protein [Rubidibacter lacunae]ERN40781.1 hypothetical protein KR51_00027700 [Rubidibacter lacunae KORDI 51-2]
MKAARCSPSICRYCRSYTPVGRRGGNCQKLGVPVRATWQACSLADSPFASPWQRWEATLALLDDAVATAGADGWRGVPTAIATESTTEDANSSAVKQRQSVGAGVRNRL